MSGITARRALLAGISCMAAAAFATPVAEASITVEAKDSKLFVAPESFSEAGYSVVVQGNVDVSDTRIRMRFDRVPAAVSPCVLIDASPAVVECPRRGKIEVVGTNGRDFVNLDIAVPGLDAKVNGAGGNDAINGTGSHDSLAGGPGDDYINGYNGNDGVYGQAGNDRVYGRSGDDLVTGGSGKDELYPGSGEDRVYMRTQDLAFESDGQDDWIAAKDGDNDELYCDAAPYWPWDKSGSFDSFDDNNGSANCRF